MCGIAGIVHARGRTVSRELLTEMTTAIAHRGPDGAGAWVEGAVGLGHRRLSIIDLSNAASQPMERAYGEERHVLVFNGEAYNFVELRDELIAQGEQFRSTGDTEVLLAAIARWGAARAVSRVNGMLAIGYWNSASRELVLARDRFGKKPLYYAPLGGPDARDGLVFASELRALLAHPSVRAERRIDHAALAQYLLHEFVPAPRSILENVRKVMPGEIVRWSESRGLTRETYYTPPLRHDPATARTPTAMLARTFLDRVTEATRDRLVADVPVGVFLSGGLDSSLLTACAVRSHPRVRTFSIGFEDASFDESEHAALVARHLGTEHHVERVRTVTLLDRVPAMLDWIDEPFADSSLLPTTMVAEIARKHVTVALGGDGGDEIQGGYPTLMLERALGALPALPEGLSSLTRRATALLPVADANFSLGFKLRQFTAGLSARGARRHARWLAPLVPDEIASLLTDPRGLESMFEPTDRAAEGLTHTFDAATAFYLRVYLAEGVLTKVDRATMRHSLEARAPLLDPRVVEMCLSLAPSLRVRGRTTKWLMREALRSVLPASILARPKKGFGSPVGAWMRGPLADLVRDTLSPSAVARGGWLDPRAVDAIVRAHLSGHEDLRKPLYTLLVLEHWRQRWFA
jgi:asparagine synthase (glutamine-hydrolysing)